MTRTMAILFVLLALTAALMGARGQRSGRFNPPSGRSAPAARSQTPESQPAGIPETQPSTRPARHPWTYYEVVVERNIFSRRPVTNGDARPPGDEPRPPAPPPPVDPPGKHLILTGTAITSDERVAFLENTRGETTLCVREGEATEVGRVVTVMSDYIELLDFNDHLLRVPIGSNLLGGTPEEPASAVEVSTTTQPAEASGGTSSGSTPASANEDEVIRRLRARRSQETGGN